MMTTTASSRTRPFQMLAIPSACVLADVAPMAAATAVTSVATMASRLPRRRSRACRTASSAIATTRPTWTAAAHVLCVTAERR